MMYTPEEQLAESAAFIASEREALSAFESEYKRLKESFDEQTADLRANIDVCKGEIEKHRAAVEAAALHIYDATGAKKLPHGIGIRVTTTLVYEEAHALQWARQHNHTEMIVPESLDKKKFEKVAKVSADTMKIELLVISSEDEFQHEFKEIQVVQVDEVPTVTLPTDTTKLRGA